MAFNSSTLWRGSKTGAASKLGMGRFVEPVFDAGEPAGEFETLFFLGFGKI